MAESPLRNSIPVRSQTASCKPIRFTAINQPWRRNSFNAALFDSPVPEGSYVTGHLNMISRGPNPKKRPREDSEDEDEEATVDEEEEEEVEEIESNLDTLLEDENEDAEPAVDLAALRETCDTYLASDPKLLVTERLLTVAGVYTNIEIVSKVKHYHPDIPLPIRLTGTIVQTISNCITRVAELRGVPREEVKQELEAARERNGVLERRLKDAREMRRGNVAAATASWKGWDEVGRIMEGGGDAGGGNGESRMVGDADAKVDSGAEVSRKPAPSGLGGAPGVEDRVVANSDDEGEL